MSTEEARDLSMIDSDAALWIEYEDSSRQPIALIETAEDHGQANKPATVTQNLARMAGIPAYCVLYQLADIPNPAQPDYQDISQFRVKRLHPIVDTQWHRLTPKQWAEHLAKLRDAAVMESSPET